MIAETEVPWVIKTALGSLVFGLSNIIMSLIRMFQPGKP